MGPTVSIDKLLNGYPRSSLENSLSSTLRARLALVRISSGYLQPFIVTTCRHLNAVQSGVEGPRGSGGVIKFRVSHTPAGAKPAFHSFWILSLTFSYFSAPQCFDSKPEIGTWVGFLRTSGRIFPGARSDSSGPKVGFFRGKGRIPPGAGKIRPSYRPDESALHS